MLNIALAGLGTVGAGVVRLLRTNWDVIAARAGVPIKIRAVSAKNKDKVRDCDLSNVEWVDDPRLLVTVAGVDAVVELIGGENGIARELAESAIKNGKHVVTANKALIAAHGATLAAMAESAKVQLYFEAAVAGGIPVIKALREGMGGNRLSLVRGILNGTCNYILTRMGEAALSFADALQEAQQRGYAEADPSADIDGHDAANKLAILAALAFGGIPDLAGVQVEGIRHISPLDLQFAEELGCRVKLLGVARPDEKGVSQRVGPSLVSADSTLAQVSGALNAVLLRGDFAGDLLLEGQGAGAEPTASAVVSDLIDLASGHHFKGRVFSKEPYGSGTKMPPVLASKSCYYLRLQVMDKPGVVADISAILRDEAISINSLIQRGKSAVESVPVVITTHEADAAAMRRAAEKIAHVGTVVEKPCVIRIED